MCGSIEARRLAEKRTYLVSLSSPRFASSISCQHPAQDISFDIGQIMIPQSLGPGNFVMKYSWATYFTCVDIAVLPPKANGDLAIPVGPDHDFSRHAWYDPAENAPREWIRIDHCQVVRRTLGKWSEGETLATSAAFVQSTYAAFPLDDAGLKIDACGVGETDCVGRKITEQAACIAIPPPGNLSSLQFTDQEALELCQDRAVRVKAKGINVVPMDPPPGVRMSVDHPGATPIYYNSDPASANVASGMNIPWGIGNCQRKYFANEPAGTKICYPLTVYGVRGNTEPDYFVEEMDTEDEIWYSTCYKSARLRKFDTPCGHQCQETRLKEWRFGDHCISCADATRNSDPFVVPHWEVADTASCRACWAPVSDAPPFQPAPEDAAENGWVSPDGGMSMTWTRTVGTTDSVTFVVSCAACTTESGWLAIGPSPRSGMVGTHAVRWRFSGTDVVDEVRISEKSASGFEVVAPGNLNGVVTTSESGQAKKLTFSASLIGDTKIPGNGDQAWAWAFRTGDGFTQHSGSSNERGVALLSFTLNPPPTPPPTKPPVFDPAAPIHNDNETPKPDPTAAPTLAPSLLPPDSTRPRVEATVTLVGCAAPSFADGTMVRKFFVSILAQNLALQDKDVIVMEIHALVGKAAHRRLAGASEVGQSASVKFAVLGYAPSTPEELLQAITLFLGDSTATGFEFLLQEQLYGTLYQTMQVAVGSAPVIVTSSQAIVGGTDSGDSTDSGAAAALISLSVVGGLCVALVAALAAAALAVVLVTVLKRNERRSSAALSTKGGNETAGADVTGGHVTDIFGLVLVSGEAVGTEAFDAEADVTGEHDIVDAPMVVMENPCRDSVSLLFTVTF